MGYGLLYLELVAVAAILQWELPRLVVKGGSAVFLLSSDCARSCRFTVPWGVEEPGGVQVVSAQNEGHCGLGDGIGCLLRFDIWGN